MGESGCDYGRPDKVQYDSHSTAKLNGKTGFILTMVNGDVVAFNVASFMCALFVLEFGADKFVDHTAVVACRTGISPALIGLLTAGAEWEEVRERSVCQHTSS